MDGIEHEQFTSEARYSLDATLSDTVCHVHERAACALLCFGHPQRRPVTECRPSTVTHVFLACFEPMASIGYLC